MIVARRSNIRLYGLFIGAGALIIASGVLVSHTRLNHSVIGYTALNNKGNAVPVKPLSLDQRTEVALSPTVYESLRVHDASGNDVTLDVRKAAMFFFNYLMGGTDAAKSIASQWNQLKEKPTFICTGWPSGTDMSVVYKSTQRVLASAGLPTISVYYLYGNPFGKYVTGLPDTYVWQGGLVYHVPGIPPNPQDWVNVFGGGLK